jgi:dolichol-phosphate mannosyltransferase
MNYSIILPTLNENGHIIDLINSIIKNFTNTKNNYEIIVVDDNSNDGTISTIKKYIIKNKKIKLFIRKNKKKNLAKSINLGIIKSKYENIIWMDADFQHPPRYIRTIFKYVKKYDVVIFSRFLKKSRRYFDGGKLDKEANENQSILFNNVCKKIFYNDITDYTSGYIYVKKEKIKNLTLNGFYGEYFLNLILYCKKNNFKILEIPFNEKFRKTGSSKTIGGSSIRYMIICTNYVISIIKNLYLKLFT